MLASAHVYAHLRRFFLDVVLTAFDLQHNPTKHALRFKKPRSGPFKKKISPLYKNAINEKGIRTILIKIIFLRSAQRQLSNGIFHFFCGWNHFPTNRGVFLSPASSYPLLPYRCAESPVFTVLVCTKWKYIPTVVLTYMWMDGKRLATKVSARMKKLAFEAAKLSEITQGHIEGCDCPAIRLTARWRLSLETISLFSRRLNYLAFVIVLIRDNVPFSLEKGEEKVRTMPNVRPNIFYRVLPRRGSQSRVRPSHQFHLYIVSEDYE